MKGFGTIMIIFIVAAGLCGLIFAGGAIGLIVWGVTQAKKPLETTKKTTTPSYNYSYRY